MSKGPWKNRNVKRVNGKFVSLKDSAVDGNAGHDGAKPSLKVEPVSPPGVGDGSIPPPLPPLSGPPSGTVGSQPTPAAPTLNMNDEALKVALGKIFCNTTNGLAYWANKVTEPKGIRIEFEKVEPEMGSLWGEFALPVLKLWMPKLQDDPKWALGVVTVMILGGKIKVIKVHLQGVPNAGNTSPSENGSSQNQN